jgi:hypothetical protein
MPGECGHGFSSHSLLYSLGKDQSWGPNRGPILDWKEGWLRPRNKEAVLAWAGGGRRGEVRGDGYNRRDDL